MAAPVQAVQSACDHDGAGSVMRTGRQVRFWGTGVALAGALVLSAPLRAQSADLAREIDAQADTLQAMDEEGGPQEPEEGGKVRFGKDLLIAPIPVSNPALGTGLAVTGVLYYNPKDEPTPWVTGVGAGYTSTDTWGAGFYHQMSFGQDRFRVAAMGGYGDARLNFYGIGPNAGDAGVSVDLRNRGTSAYLDGEVRLFDKGLLSNLHVGARVSYLRIRSSIGIPTPNRPDLNLPTIERRSTVSAIGPSFTFDTRNHPFNPSKGVLVTGTWMFGADFLGSDFEHRKLELLSTGYFSLTDSTVLAVRKTACAVKGNAPFYDLCMFGKNGDLRGYEAGRYRDGATWAFQLEVRQRLTPKLGVVGFAGVGGIAASSGDIWKHSHTLASGGAGLRYLASKANNVNLRFDVAWGKDGAAYYFGIGEAF
ncbi:BamA/TamA family outer membrane protein [Novosphingobium mangrovi (ex Hu et al. 2023)]|uniref:BamA/TamA family outer membrane protein n=1 Tax=Novosphingobium mangrovi (ex Hu et al. 2023) TaxID=2930094 RepID=A0ABT0A7Z9_9SPHN|nr:BamA/TamA family outer membrane protein [Novosphingobium mangrovi (ex Hu et al. 2023)]MCJ1959334.1 BamA/TamA family outer membrane protein [Novosphingobium mangrovi (ex Hu et al. 2023)]